MSELLEVEGITKLFKARPVLKDVSFSVRAGEVLRKFVKRGSENVPLARNQWHTLQISVHGTNLQASLNGKHLLDYTLTEPVSGRVGVWSKTDSVSYFDDYTVTR
jgi:ABC-type phosphonate transport system ATPase subunit